METVDILVVCKHESILQTILRLLNNQPEWNAIGLSTTQDIFEKCDEKVFDLVLIGSGLDEKEETELIEKLSGKHKNMKVLKHYGGGSGLLSAEIHQALLSHGG